MLESESRRAPAPMELDGVQGTLGENRDMLGNSSGFIANVQFHVQSSFKAVRK